MLSVLLCDNCLCFYHIFIYYKLVEFGLFAGHFPVTVYGEFLPRHIFYRFHAICAYIRCIFVAICMVLMWPSFDVVLADQVSAVVPVLKLKRSSKVGHAFDCRLMLFFMWDLLYQWYHMASYLGFYDWYIILTWYSCRLYSIVIFQIYCLHSTQLS